MTDATARGNEADRRVVVTIERAQIDGGCGNLRGAVDREFLPVVHPWPSQRRVYPERLVHEEDALCLPGAAIGGDTLGRQAHAAEYEHPGNVVGPHPSDQAPRNRWQENWFETIDRNHRLIFADKIDRVFNLNFPREEQVKLGSDIEDILRLN